jgi:hypothetical protein
MSSETSIESHDPVRLKPDTTDSLHPWQLFTLAGLIGATVVVFMSRGHTPAGIILLSLIIFAAAVVGLAAWRMFMPFTVSDERIGPRMLGGRTRAALEREKALVLRAIKDLEFDRAMGKTSEKDFIEMGARLRLRAAGLIQQLDAGVGYREQIEKEISNRVARTQSGSRGEPDKARPTTQTCPSCSTSNDLDARFCKNCGASLKQS